MNEAVSGITACERCGCPLAGNESYCSNCGKRVDGGGRSVRGLAFLVLLAVLAGIGTCVFASKRPPPPHAARAERSSPNDGKGERR